MVKIITNHDAERVRGRQRRWVYNALDTAVTFEVFETLEPRLDDWSRRVYTFERSMQNVAMTLQVRGIRVDEVAAQKAIKEVKAMEKRAQEVLDRIAEVWWGKGLNPRSPAQLKEFLYDVLRLPPQYDRKSGKVTTGLAALEALAKKAPWARIIIRAILRGRELRKQLSFLEAPRSADGRLRASFNVGATETGRWSSSRNAFNEGLNYQNVYKKLRYIFVPDPGLKMGQSDLEQAESHVVAMLSGDPGYIEAHKSFDTHTYVCKLVWPDLDWPNDEGPQDVALASEPNFIRHFSRRDLSKRVQHGTNYGASEYVLSQILQISRADAKDAQDRYLKAFPGIKNWQDRIKLELRRYGWLATPLGRRRQFFDRVWESTTQREAISFVPQGTVGDILNVGLYRVWRDLDGRVLWLLNQGHDSILYQFDPAHEKSVVEAVEERLKVRFEIEGREVCIGVDTGTGENWLATG